MLNNLENSKVARTPGYSGIFERSFLRKVIETVFPQATTVGEPFHVSPRRPGKG